MNGKNAPDDKKETFLEFPKMYAKSFMKLPFKTDSYFIEIKKNDLPKPKPGTYENDTWITFSIVYDLEEVYKDSEKNVIFNVVPRKAMVRQNDKIYWEGKINYMEH